MIISYNVDGTTHSITGFRIKHTHEMINSLHPVDGYDFVRIYDLETINKVWGALDTGGTVRVELDDKNEPIGLITENGDLEPAPSAEGVPLTKPRENDLLKQEIADLAFQKMLLEHELRQQKQAIADLEFSLMMGGVI